MLLGRLDSIGEVYQRSRRTSMIQVQRHRGISARTLSTRDHRKNSSNNLQMQPKLLISWQTPIIYSAAVNRVTKRSRVTSITITLLQVSSAEASPLSKAGSPIGVNALVRATIIMRRQGHIGNEMNLTRILNCAKTSDTTHNTSAAHPTKT